MYTANKHSILHCLFVIVIVSSICQKAFWYIHEVRVFVSDLAILAFILCYLYAKVRTSTYGLNRIASNLLKIHMMLLIYIMASAAFVSIFGVLDFSLFFKGIIVYVLDTLFVVLGIDFIERNNRGIVYWFSIFFLATSAASVFYGCLQGYLLDKIGIDLDKAVLQTVFSEPWHVGIDQLGAIYRISGFLADPNHFGIAIVLSTMLLFGLLSARNFGGRVFRTIAYPLLIVVYMLGLFLTLSRSAVLAFIVSVAIYAYLNGSLGFRHFIFKLVPVAFLILFAYKCLDSSLRESIDAVIAFKADFSSEGISDRRILYFESLKLFSADTLNMFLGVGYNNFSFAYYRLTGIPDYNAHSAWLSILVELGLLGFSLECYLYYYILRVMARASFRVEGDPDKFGICCLSGFCGLLSANLFYTTLAWNYCVVYEVIMLGYATIILKNE
mgnify:CR=1 FL=1